MYSLSWTCEIKLFVDFVFDDIFVPSLYITVFALTDFLLCLGRGVNGGKRKGTGAL